MLSPVDIREKTMRFELSKVIDRPVERVFQFIADGENMTKWDAKVREIKKISEEILKEETKYFIRREFPGEIIKEVLEIIEYDVNRSLIFAIVYGLNSSTYRYKFESIGMGDMNEKGTLLSLNAEVGINRFRDLIRTVKEVEQNLENIKSILEAEV